MYVYLPSLLQYRTRQTTLRTTFLPDRVFVYAAAIRDYALQVNNILRDTLGSEWTIQRIKMLERVPPFLVLLITPCLFVPFSNPGKDTSAEGGTRVAVMLGTGLEREAGDSGADVAGELYGVLLLQF